MSNISSPAARFRRNHGSESRTIVSFFGVRGWSDLGREFTLGPVAATSLAAGGGVDQSSEAFDGPVTPPLRLSSAAATHAFF
jgi:hypothetical protein